MCREGAFTSRRSKRILGMHVYPSMTTGTLAGNPGIILAATSEFEATIHGRGGHGTMPHMTIDPVTCVAKIIVEGYRRWSRAK